MKMLLRAFLVSGLLSASLFLSCLYLKETHAVLSHLLYIASVVSVFTSVASAQKVRHMPVYFHATLLAISVMLIVLYVTLLYNGFRGSESALSVFAILSMLFVAESVMALGYKCSDRAEGKLPLATVTTVFDKEQFRKQMQEDGLL